MQISNRFYLSSSVFTLQTEVFCKKTVYWNVYFTERLDQIHLHSKLEVPRLGIEIRPPRWEVSTLAKSYWNSLLISIRNIYIWASDKAPPVHVVTWTYMNTHELHYDVGWLALACRSTLNIDIIHLQVRVFTVKQDRSLQGHHYGETWPRSSPSYNRGHETDISWLVIEPRHLPWEVSTLAKSY